MSRASRGPFTRTVHRIAVATVAIGVAASLVALLVMRGFQHTVEDKIYQFGGHLLMSRLTLNNAVEGSPFSFDIDLYRHPHDPRYPCVERVEEYAYKSGLIRTRQDALGIVFKGIGRRFDVPRFTQNIVEGRFIALPDSGYAKQVVISRRIADKMNIDVQDDIVIHFFQDPPRFRKLRVTGIYETNLSEYFDDKIVFGDLRLIQRLNGWADSVATGLEIRLNDHDCVERAYAAIGEAIDYDLYLEPTRQKYDEVFEWLDLIGRQVRILLTIIFVVVCVNMVSIALISVMERTQMIGLLKAIGAPHRLIRQFFLYSGLRFIAKGLIYGNLLGLGVCFLQYRFRWIKLNPRDYYMDVAPVAWDWGAVAFINLLAPLAVGLALFVPAAVAARIDPLKAIRFD